MLSQADHCVKCGLCLPHCPTYRLTSDEGDSPRGRIALMQALAEGTIQSPRAGFHLQRCLGCRSCETACPSGVKYGAMLDATRELLLQESGNEAGLNWLATNAYKPWGRHILRAYQKSGLRHLARTVGGTRFRRLDQLLPPVESDASSREVYPAAGKTRGRVGLFTGCVSRLTDKTAIEGAITTLTLLGIEVIVPRTQACCGAVQLHSGNTTKNSQLTENNRQAFSRWELDAILTLASGCGGHLLEQQQGGSLDTAPIKEFSQFIMQLPWVEELNFQPTAQRIMLHTPCSLKNVQRCPDEPFRMLNLIPGIQIEPLPDTGCCGGAGTYMLNQPEMADRLRSPMIELIAKTKPDFVATSNTGCALHLRAGLVEAGITIPVVHPTEIIARQLPIEAGN
ncbi:hypothetical protein BOW51_09590 [Solemya velesiana gill symbiont]|uniref:Glycolate oxidase iron-sulfur subunit n=1 Tax=Solemya velesiana gill symbiont TaxID=1918948 RepID=A0A1T2KSX8_9GAMM|nr:hypothetical protein BOW51_09590 [Solemya velesiana gill symbiont]